MHLRIALAWTAIAVVATVLAIAHVLAIGRPDLIGAAVFGNDIFVAIWAFSTPVIFAAAAKYPIRGRIGAYVLAFAVFFIGTNAIVRAPFAISRGWSWYARGLAGTLTEYAVPAALAFTVLVAIGQWLAAKTALTHVAIADRGSVHRVPVDAIHWIEAEDNYVLIHTPQRTYTARERISDFETKLDERRFARVHRSAIVNLASVAEVRALSHGDYEVVLRCGTSVRGSRSRRAVLDRLRQRPVFG